MAYNSGKLLFILIVAVLLSCVAAWVVAYRYRAVMQRLMLAPVIGTHETAPFSATANFSPPAVVSLDDNRRAGIQLTLVLIALSFLLALTSAGIWYSVAFPGEPLPIKRIAAVALLHLWPMIPALGLMWRWSRKRLFAVLALWCIGCFLILLWRSLEPRPMELASALAAEIGPGMAIVALMLLGNATRAIAPWLLLPFTGLAWASIVGTDILAVMVEKGSPLIMSLAGWLGANTVLVLFVLLPWALAWWPLRRLGQALGRAYSRKWLSDLMVVFTTIWAISILEKAVTTFGSAGLYAVAMFLPLLWIPLVMLVYRRMQTPKGRPPTLLVLRVFQHDEQVRELFDHVIERWRLSGNTVMIAGTDLAERTLDAEDIFTFLDGKLAERFIRTPADVAPRIAAFDMAPDADGRYRVNECYCHDTTWQNALHALVEGSDVVLMDLRGFKAHNAGCRYEMDVLSKAARPVHVVMLFDAQTDRAAASDTIGRDSLDRFVWLDATLIDTRKRRDVLSALFDYRLARPVT